MQDKKKLILIILSIGAVASLSYGILTPSALNRRLSTEEVILKEVGVIPSISGIGLKRSAKRTRYDDWGRDPFELPIVRAALEKAATLTLNCIIWDRANPTAIIDDRIVSPGDKIGKNTILKITPRKVKLNDGTKDFELMLEEGR